MNLEQPLVIKTLDDAINEATIQMIANKEDLK